MWLNVYRFAGAAFESSRLRRSLSMIGVLSVAAATSTRVRDVCLIIDSGSDEWGDIHTCAGRIVGAASDSYLRLGLARADIVALRSSNGR